MKRHTSEKPYLGFIQQIWIVSIDRSTYKQEAVYFTMKGGEKRNVHHSVVAVQTRMHNTTPFWFLEWDFREKIAEEPRSRHSIKNACILFLGELVET